MAGASSPEAALAGDRHGARDASDRGESFPEPVVRTLGERDYEPTWRAMRAFTDERGPGAADEIWLLSHPGVYTLGQAGRAEHVLDAALPVVRSDRGGQVTYHGPGQLIAYVLVDLRRLGLGVRTFVHALEQAVIDTLAGAGIEAGRRPGAPGVYVAGAKIAALGLRVRRGCSYHGISLNVDLDLAPFSRIDPCGYAGLAVTRTRDHGVDWSVDTAGRALARTLVERLRPARC